MAASASESERFGEVDAQLPSGNRPFTMAMKERHFRTLPARYQAEYGAPAAAFSFDLSGL